MLLASLRQLGKHSLIYGLGSVLAKLLAFLLLPLYTRYLTPADYGVYSLLIITGTVAGILLKLGLGSALFREVIYQESEESTVVSTSLYFLLAESALFLALLLLISAQLSSLIFGVPDYAYLLRLIFISATLGVLDVVAMVKLRIHTQSALFAALTVTKLLIAIALNILFIVVLRRGVEGLVMTLVIQSAISAGISLAILARELRPAFSVPILKRLLTFGVPLVPFGLSAQVLTYADRYFLKHFSTATEVGLYSLGYNIGMVLNLLVSAVQLAWPAQMFAIAKQPNAEKHLSRILTYYLLFMGFVGLGLSVLAREVLRILTTPSFYGAYVVVPLVSMSCVFYGVMYMTNSGLETRNKVKYMSVTIVIAAIFNLSLNYLLIPSYGMMGAAWATFISYLALAAIQLAINLHFWYIRYEYGRILRLVVAWGLIYAASLFVRTQNIWLDASLKLALLATYPLILYLLRFYSRDELNALQQISRTLTSRIIRLWGGIH